MYVDNSEFIEAVSKGIWVDQNGEGRSFSSLTNSHLTRVIGSIAKHGLLRFAPGGVDFSSRDQIRRAEDLRSKVLTALLDERDRRRNLNHPTNLQLNADD